MPSQVLVLLLWTAFLLPSQALSFFEDNRHNEPIDSEESKEAGLVSILNTSFSFSNLRGSPAAEDKYYAQFDFAYGIEIKASNIVDPKALIEAKRIITMMLKDVRPDIKNRLVAKKAALAIIPRDKFVTSLPEFSYLSGKTDVNGNPYDSFKIRGLGAKGRPVTATSEENLLKLPNDTFKAEDITVHEFAHAVMNLGFTFADFEKINDLYKNAVKKGYFRGTFAMVRIDEFWAELTQSFFSVNNEIGGPEQILAQDYDSYNYLKQIYNTELELKK